MTGFMLLGGLNGSTDWSLPSDWRLLPQKVESAFNIISYCHQDYSRISALRVVDLGDVLSAIDLVRATPPQFRSAGSSKLASLERGRDIKSVKHRPKASAFNFLSLAVNPVATVAGLGLNIAARKAGRRVVAHLTDDEEWLETALSSIEVHVIDTQLESVLTNSDKFPRQPDFDGELGRRVYWLGFVYPTARKSVQSNFVFSATRATQAIAESEQALAAMRGTLGSLLTSPMAPGILDLDEIERKIKKGKHVPILDEAWNWHCAVASERQRHVLKFATRMGWSTS